MQRVWALVQLVSSRHNRHDFVSRVETQRTCRQRRQRSSSFATICVTVATSSSAYLAAIRTAKREIIIANSYFFPGIRFRRALIAAAERGVTVTLLLQGRIEYMLLHLATRALYGQLLQAGITIEEYHRSMLHAKVAVVDDHWATVGSSNIDPYSLLMAREANVVVRDRASTPS